MKSSGVIAFLTLKFPIRVRRNSDRWAPELRALPKSWAKDLMYVPLLQTTLNFNSFSLIEVISNSEISIVRGLISTDSPARAN